MSSELVGGLAATGREAGVRERGGEIRMVRYRLDGGRGPRRRRFEAVGLLPCERLVTERVRLCVSAPFSVSTSLVRAGIVDARANAGV